MPEATDTDYLDAFRRGLLDPEECVSRWERMYAEASAHVLELAELPDQTDARLDETWEAVKPATAERN